ncbi:Nuclear distribution protein nudF 2 (Lissencephaly-1 homolog 2) (LIS-1 2) [Durusdinium trenchii]|uniref:Nuclear distribution protein nudF 2 (Lissencephaly-1 homolog 2) (LIS-1 2) n=1 Tax=Durusdinium trenchii TaxID=1381693 RepID=A0ABP0SJZ2_9DINO
MSRALRTASVCCVSLFLIHHAAGNCACTNIGPGSAGVSRGLPVEYGTSCAAWDDGDCSAHACGTLQQCNELYPDSTSGLWCCRAWCYVSASCTLTDVQPTTVGSSSLYYSYQACSVAVSYNDTTCPWQQDVSFEEAAAAIMVAEKIGDLLADAAAVNVAVGTTGGSEVAVVANEEPKLCLYGLRSYGGERIFCTGLLSAPAYSLAISPDWVASASEGSTSIDFWQLNSVSLSLLGTMAATSRLQYLKHTSLGLLGATEDEMVTLWPMANMTKALAGEETHETLGPFSWAPKAIEVVTFGQTQGLALASFADIEIWVKSDQWSKLTRLSGHSRLVTSLSFLPSMGLLASASMDSNVGIWHHHEGSWKLATLLYDHTHPVKAIAWIPSGPLLASGDEQELILWRPATSPSCEFTSSMGYYLPGFNRYVVADKTVDECRSLCCENPWCTSFDYAEQGDGKTHGPKTCWLSSAGEGVNGGGGLTWDPANNYHYYEVTKRGSRFMTLAQKKGIASLNLASSSSLLLSRDQQGGSVDVWKLTTSVCPDRQMAKGDGAQCKLCPLGRAGTGGLCPVCRPGTFAPEEGLDACEPCPLGTEMRDLGGVTCSACQVGTYAAELGTARCTACRPGYFNDRTGSQSAAECRACGVSHFSTSFGASSCEQCPAGQGHDSYAVPLASACVSCNRCGTDLVDGCPIPKDANCQNCPAGRVKTQGASCEYCPHGQIPNGIPQGDTCLAFPRGDFNAVSDHNSRSCWTRRQYGEIECPLHVNGGWLTDNTNTNTQKFLTLSSTENEICSNLHCMGGIIETQEIYNRMYGSGCTVDSDLQELCLWSKEIINWKISQREAALRRVEDANLLEMRKSKCQEVCNCAALCAEVTSEEDAKEDAFDVLPFSVVTCEVHGTSSALTCHATCTSSRPAKTVNKPWQCMRHEEVSKIQVQMSTLPRCQASCSTCPDESVHGSFRLCDATSAAAARVSARVSAGVAGVAAWAALAASLGIEA